MTSEPIWEIYTTETDDKQHSIDNMGDTLLEKLEAHVNANNIHEAHAIFQELSLIHI